MHALRCAAALGIVCFATPQLEAETAIRAEALVDSVGVNTHMSYGPIYETNFPLVLQRLKQLGVRHVREGLVKIDKKSYYADMSKLGPAGIHLLVLTSSKFDTSTVLAYPALMPQTIEAFEGPNEYDISGDTKWAADLRSYMTQLYGAVKLNPTTSKMPVLGPSLTKSSSWAALGEESGYTDYGNLHDYPGGRNPGTSGWGPPDAEHNHYGSIDWNIDQSKAFWGGKPIIATEYGYDNNTADSESVPESVAGIYYPRAILEQFMHGIARTYFFEFIGESYANKEGKYALLDSAGNPKPAFVAVSSVLGLLSDPAGGTFSPAAMDFNLNGDTANLQHLLLEKSNGTYYLALWIELPCYDVNTKSSIAIPAQTITISLARASKGFKVHHLSAAGTDVVSSDAGQQSLSLKVSDKLTIVEIPTR